MAIKIQGDTVIFDDKVFKVGSGTTAQRPASPETGMIWFNTSLNSFEGYDPVGLAWAPIGEDELARTLATLAEFADNLDVIKDALNATGTAPIYAARAWVNFNGTGTVAIRASGNVSSITDNGVGTYTVNFTNAMPDVNYSAMFLAGSNNANITTVYENTFTDRTTSSINVNVINITGSATFDSNSVNVAILR